MDSSSSLYCSQDCKSKDDSSINTEEEDEKRIIFKPTLSTSKSTTATKKPKYPLLQHKSTSSTTYPWIPLYRKRHHNNVLLNAAKRYCQPSVAGSPINATAVLSSSLIR